MAEYYVIEVIKCPECNGDGFFVFDQVAKPCCYATNQGKCVRGHFERRVSLLDVLKKLRWTEHNSLQDIRYEDLRIEDENSSADDS